jgi:hypothetical protein
MAASKKVEEKKPITTGTSNGHITNLNKYILETFDIYGTNIQNNTEAELINEMSCHRENTQQH